MFHWMRVALVLLPCWFSLPGLASAADLKILPGDITLTGPHAAQRLLVVADDGGVVVRDRTPQAQFTSANPAVVVVDGGVLHPAGDGETTITATVDGQRATATVKVVRSKEPINWSFRNHVIPMMTKVGCNSGACHGALAGKGGQKLSLRGYDPEADYFVLTRQALGRRVNLIEPSKSLVLRKPTLAVPHGGGQKLEVGSPDYQSSRRLDRRRRPRPQGRRPRHPAPRSAAGRGRAEAEGHAANAGTGVVLRRPFRGRDALGQVQQQRGPRGRRGRRRQGDRGRLRRGRDHRLVLEPRRRQPHRLAAAERRRSEGLRVRPAQ